jgi:hypothetical protein
MRLRRRVRPVNAAGAAEGPQRRIAELEGEAEAEQRREDRARDQAIAAAECAHHGHVEPDGGPFADTVEISAWGQAAPIRVGPHCTRCGANLSEETA